MSRLIDANSLQRLFDTLSKNKWNKSSFTSWAMAYEAAKTMVDDEVTVDAVPVVRCKDCTYASWRDIDGGVWKCKMAMGDEYHEDDFYCAWGEKCEDE